MKSRFLRPTESIKYAFLHEFVNLMKKSTGAALGFSRGFAKAVRLFSVDRL
ncbi:hypothetical protein [Desulfatibacillum aliphaticivorans]|uniref:hypothetical protein n=1 Tax=Desulfatibacillum aliphaticivorans TaxID=218208 RepID=UPI0002E8BDDB|nr:hypothetical protein [Desulfatibacillum aliphaticivorans]